MSSRIISTIILLAVFILSCNSDVEKKSDNVSSQPAQKDSAVNKPKDDYLMYENKLKQDSLNIELRLYLAANYYSDDNLDRAAYHYNVVYQIDPKNLDALKNLGNIYYDSHQDDKAIRFYEKALSIQPDNIDMRCDLATCYSRINKLKKATEILRENIKKNPKHAQSHYNLSVILKQAGKESEAEEEMGVYKGIVGGGK